MPRKAVTDTRLYWKYCKNFTKSREFIVIKRN